MTESPAGGLGELGGDILSKMDYLKDFVESEAHMIFEFAATGGFENASNF